MPQRDLQVTTVDRRILSSYGDKPLADMADGHAPQDVADALLALCLECPWLRVTSFRRSAAVQASMRQRYENWVAAGKPAVGKGYDSKTMKNAFVAKPGKSMHNAGRAVDLNTETMRKALGAEYLDAFWPIAARHGFTPIISKPTEGASEGWHFDHRGPWDNVGDHYGYEQMAMCAALAVGDAGEWQSKPRLIQALVLRAGYDIGEADGVVGSRTLKGLELVLGKGYQAQFPNTDRVIAALYDLEPGGARWEVVRT